MNTVKNGTHTKKQTVLLAFALLIFGINVQAQEHNHEHSDANSLSKNNKPNGELRVILGRLHVLCRL